jgi:hypothetical protein
MDFASLQHIRNRRSTCRGLCRPATFRPQGLATLLAVYSLRSRAGSFSHRQRSWDSPFGAFPSRKVSRCITTRMGPPTVSLLGAPAAVAMGRPKELRFLGFNPFESPLPPDRGLVSRQPDAPLGFAPSRVHHRRPRSRFRPNASLTLCLPDDESSGTPASQSVNQPSTRSIRHAAASCNRRTERPS